MDAMREMRMQIFSRQYYDFVDIFAKTEFEESKILGKFYTNERVAEQMIVDLLLNYKPKDASKLKIIDPFCGDGRLIRILLEKLIEIPQFEECEYEVVLWDIDKSALDKAKKDIDDLVKRENISASISCERTDAFVMYGERAGEFDVCVTNPPWGILKPQKLFNDRCAETEIEEYKKAIAIYDEYMREEFVLSQPTKKFGKWGTNLGRAGTEVALRLISDSGICGLVSPASLFNDQVSLPLRSWLFEEHCIHGISYFPAELKLYGSADVSSVTTIIGTGKTDSSIEIKIYSSETEFTHEKLSKKDMEYIKRNKYLLPLENGFDMFSILQKFEQFPQLVEFCEQNNYYFTRELDETKISEKLKPDGDIVFAKGYMVDRYDFNSDGLFLDENKSAPPDSAGMWKIVWRDVSRNSQKKRVKATLLSKNHIAGNSLGVIACRDEFRINEFKKLLAVMNSYIFEFQARSQLVSNHVPAGIIKQQRIPMQLGDDLLPKLVDRALAGEECKWQIELSVASIYGLSKSEFLSIISHFELEKKDKEDLDRLLNNRLEIL